MTLLHIPLLFSMAQCIKVNMEIIINKTTRMAWFETIPFPVLVTAEDGSLKNSSFQICSNVLEIKLIQLKITSFSSATFIFHANFFLANQCLHQRC